MSDRVSWRRVSGLHVSGQEDGVTLVTFHADDGGRDFGILLPDAYARGFADIFGHIAVAAEPAKEGPRCSCGHLVDQHTVFYHHGQTNVGDCAVCGKRCGTVPR